MMLWGRMSGTPEIVSCASPPILKVPLLNVGSIEEVIGSAKFLQPGVPSGKKSVIYINVPS
jgi:hypothetical protein